MCETRLEASTAQHQDHVQTLQQLEGDRPILQNILTVVPLQARGWPLLTWFDTPNDQLDRRKPRDVLLDLPDDVTNAAIAFYR